MDAGRRLAEACAAADLLRPVVLGLPRGGMPVAAPVAARLDAPLDVLPVRKIGAPGNPELGIGAVAEGGARHLDDAMVRALELDTAACDRMRAQAERELERSVERFRIGPPVPLTGRTAVIVDDGIATGGTIRTAVLAARQRGAPRIVVATPVAAAHAVETLRALADDVICLHVDPDLRAVGQWYRDFAPVDDDAVLALLGAGGPDHPTTQTVLIDQLEGDLGIPVAATGVVVFAHGSGSSRHSPRNRSVAARLRQAGVATLLLDLLTPLEAEDRARVFDIPLLASRLVGAIEWVAAAPGTAHLPIGLFGASTGAAAALRAAADDPDRVRAVVSRGGRPDLAGDALPRVRAPVLLLVGGHDREVLALNEQARDAMTCPVELVVVPGATHLFEEPGTLEAVADRAAAWFADRLR